MACLTRALCASGATTNYGDSDSERDGDDTDGSETLDTDSEITLPKEEPIPILRRRFSESLGCSRLEHVALKDVNSVDALSKTKAPLRILITTHSLNFAQTNTIEHGLGLWVFYIFREYLIMRNIPHVLYLKSIVIEKDGTSIVDPFKATTVEDIKDFIKRNKIDILIPSDVTDTQFVAKHHDCFSPIVKSAVTPHLSVYQTLEDKWKTFGLMTELNIPTPETEKLEGSTIAKSYPFFLKITSGTNSGRGVWLIKSKEQLGETLELKVIKDKDVTLIVQKPIFGQVICAEIIYNHGRVLGFFFAQSVQADNLAGMGKKYIWGGDNPEDYSHENVNLDEEQWQTIIQISKNIGNVTNYHGMIDIEFIIANADNEAVDEGSVWLLECNPRFSGDIHATLSNPDFLGLYLDVVMGEVDEEAPIRNFSTVELQTKFALFKPLPFYTKHPGLVVNIRNWQNNCYIHYFPMQLKQGLTQKLHIFL